MLWDNVSANFQQTGSQKHSIKSLSGKSINFCRKKCEIMFPKENKLISLMVETQNTETSF